MMLWEVVLVTLVAAGFAASEVPAEQPSNTEEIPVYKTDQIQEDEIDLDNWDMATERAKGKPCASYNGTCISKKKVWKSCKGAIDVRFTCEKKHVCCINDISALMKKALEREFKQINTNQEILLTYLNECNSKVDYIIEQIEVPIARSDTKTILNTQDLVASSKAKGKSCDAIWGKCLSKKKALKSCNGQIYWTYECKDKNVCCITDTSTLLMEYLKKEIEYREEMQEILIANLKECNLQLNYTMELLATTTCISTTTTDYSTTAEPSSTVASTNGATDECIKPKGTDRCLKIFKDEEFTLKEAQLKCASEGLQLARMSNQDADLLFEVYSALFNKYGALGHLWINSPVGGGCETCCTLLAVFDSLNTGGSGGRPVRGIECETKRKYKAVCEVANTTLVTTTHTPSQGCGGGDFFKTECSDTCYKLLDKWERADWTAAHLKCKSQGLILAQATHPMALRAALTEKHGYRWNPWVAARGDGSLMRWSDGELISNSSRYWYPAEYWYSYEHRGVSIDDCLVMRTDYRRFSYPKLPPYPDTAPGAASFKTNPCENWRHVLCQRGPYSTTSSAGCIDTENTCKDSGGNYRATCLPTEYAYSSNNCDNCTCCHPKVNNRGSAVSPNLNWEKIGTDEFVRFDGWSTWDEGRVLCRSKNLDLYQPQDMTAVLFYLKENYQDSAYLVGARGNGTRMVWLSGNVVNYGGASNPYTNAMLVSNDSCLHLVSSETSDGRIRGQECSASYPAVMCG